MRVADLQPLLARGGWVEEERLERRASGLMVALRDQLVLPAELEGRGGGDDALRATDHLREAHLLQRTREREAPVFGLLRLYRF